MQQPPKTTLKRPILGRSIHRSIPMPQTNFYVGAIYDTAQHTAAIAYTFDRLVYVHLQIHGSIQLLFISMIPSFTLKSFNPLIQAPDISSPAPHLHFALSR